MNKNQFRYHLQNFKKQNGYAFAPGDTKPESYDDATNIFNLISAHEPKVSGIDQKLFNSAEKLAPMIASHIKDAGGTGEVITSEDSRKKFADVIIKRNNKTAAIVIGGDALTAGYKRDKAQNEGIDFFFHVHDQKSFINFLKGSRLKQDKTL